MTTMTPEEYDALTRTDFWIFSRRVFAELEGGAFLNNWHIEKLCAEVDRIRTEPNTRLAVAMPPRSLKSIIISIALPAWLLGHNPALEIVCICYGQELSDELADKCRRIMLTPWYRRLFPATQLDRQAVHHLVTSAGGKRYATSVGGALTGMGADVIIVDDPMKPEEAYSDAERQKINNWARHTLFTRHNDKRDVRDIIVHQRLHEDDLIGSVTALETFELISFPAIAQTDELIEIRTPFGMLTHTWKKDEALHPEREPLAALEYQRKIMGEAQFAAQYLQSPTPPGGAVVKPEWFQRYDPVIPPKFWLRFQSWDTASKVDSSNDYSVCTTWGIDEAQRIFLLHVYRARLEYPELRRKVRELALEFKATTVPMEDATSGVQLIQELARDHFAQIVPVKPKGPKDARMRNQTAAIEMGRVFIPREAHWLDTYLQEMERFPRGKHDDQVDSTSQALEWIVMTSSPAHWLQVMDKVDQMRQGTTELDEGDFPVSFDHPEPLIEFKVNSGRYIHRSADGLFHITTSEWQSVRLMQGVTLVHHPDPEPS